VKFIHILSSVSEKRKHNRSLRKIHSKALRMYTFFLKQKKFLKLSPSIGSKRSPKRDVVDLTVGGGGLAGF
jgi:hypothetical protein